MIKAQHLDGIQSKKVLVVDDDASNVLLSEIYLKSL